MMNAKVPSTAGTPTAAEPPLLKPDIDSQTGQNLRAVAIRFEVLPSSGQNSTLWRIPGTTDFVACNLRASNELRVRDRTAGVSSAIRNRFGQDRRSGRLNRYRLLRKVSLDCKSFEFIQSGCPGFAGHGRKWVVSNQFGHAGLAIPLITPGWPRSPVDVAAWSLPTCFEGRSGGRRDENSSVVAVFRPFAL